MRGKEGEGSKEVGTSKCCFDFYRSKESVPQGGRTPTASSGWFPVEKAEPSHLPLAQEGVSLVSPLAVALGVGTALPPRIRLPLLSAALGASRGTWIGGFRVVLVGALVLGLELSEALAGAVDGLQLALLAAKLAHAERVGLKKEKARHCPVPLVEGHLEGTSRAGLASPWPATPGRWPSLIPSRWRGIDPQTCREKGVYIKMWHLGWRV